MLFKSEILIIGINFAKTLAQLPKDVFIITRMFIITLFVTARNWKQPKCLVTYNEIQKPFKEMRYTTCIHTQSHTHTHL